MLSLERFVTCPKSDSSQYRSGMPPTLSGAHQGIGVNAAQENGSAKANPVLWLLGAGAGLTHWICHLSR